MSSDRYMLISSDTHAGGSHAAYREYLDPAYLEDFDAWRNKYRNPYKDLAPGDDRRLRNWDNEMRNSAQDADGVVGEVVFPNTVPPFFPSFVLFAPPPTPDVYEHRLAGVRAHNRWLADWCAEFPNRRAGIGQIFLNDVDDAVDEATWIVEHGLRGGILLPPVPPDVHDYIKPLNDPSYDRLWALCQDMEIPINLHGGTGSPTYPKLPSSTILHIQELQFYSKRPLAWLVLAGVFERFPRLRVVMTEQGCAWMPPFIEQLDGLIKNVKGGSQGELRFTPDMAPPRLASEYVQQNVWLGVSFPSQDDAPPATSSPRAAGCGEATSLTTKAPSRSRAKPSGRSSPACRSRRSGACSGSTPPTSTTSTSMPWRPRSSASGRSSRRWNSRCSSSPTTPTWRCCEGSARARSPAPCEPSLTLLGSS